MIPDNWASDGSLKQKVGKGMDDMGPELDDSSDGMDPTIALAAPDEDMPGDPTEPGSPAWESIDAATAQKWTAIAVRLKNALSIMADREMLEAVTADPDDADSAFDLQDAMCAVDFVIDTLAGFAVGEQAEAELGGEAMEAIGKAMSGFDAAPLDVIEGLTAVAKSGRVLSSANEQEIRTAAATLNKVLATLPAAPMTDDSGHPVAKKESRHAPGRHHRRCRDREGRDVGRAGSRVWPGRRWRHDRHGHARARRARGSGRPRGREGRQDPAGRRLRRQRQARRHRGRGRDHADSGR